MNSKDGPDGIDWKILEELQHNARSSNTEIGKTVGLSQPAVTSRIQRLEDMGVIEGYTARINAKCLGREITVLMRLKTIHGHIHQCLKTFEEIPEILEVYRVTGEDCFLVKGTFERMSQVEAAIDALGRFGTVTTSFILASYPPKPLTEVARVQANPATEPLSRPHLEVGRLPGNLLPERLPARIQKRLAQSGQRLRKTS